MRVFISSCLLILIAGFVSTGGFAQDKPPKIAIMNIQAAIAQCKEGQEAANTLRVKFQPKRTELEKMQKEINDLQNELKNKETTLNEEARNKLLRSVDEKTRAFNRSNEDATTEFQQAEQDAINEIGRKMLVVIDDYAKKNAYTMVLDASSPQSPILYADPSNEITKAIIDLFDASKPGSGAAPKPATEAPKPAASAPAPKPAAPAATAPKPAAPKTTP